MLAFEIRYEIRSSVGPGSQRVLKYETLTPGGSSPANSSSIGRVAPHEVDPDNVVRVIAAADFQPEPRLVAEHAN